jgi:serine/threonine protein kinase
MSGVTKHPSINLTGKSLSDVSDWLSKNKGEGRKVYGKKNENGDTILYLKSGTGLLDNLRSASGTGLLDRLRTGGDFFSSRGTRGEEKRELARSALTTLFEEDSVGRGFSATQKTGLKDLLGAVGKEAPVMQDRDAAAVSSKMEGYLNLQSKLLSKQAEPPSEKPSLVGPNDLGAILEDFRKEGQTLQDLPTYVAGRIVKNYEGASGEDASAFLLALADAKSFKDGIETELLAFNTGGLKGQAVLNPSKAETFAETILREVSAKVPACQFEGAEVELDYTSETGVASKVKAAPLTFQSETYAANAEGRALRTDVFTPEKVLAKGSDGAVVLYTNASDGSKVVLKLPLLPSNDAEDLEEAATKSAAELKLHAKIVQSGDEHVIGLKGGIRMPNGTYAIAVEFAPNGTVQEAIGKLQKAHAEGVIDDVQLDVLRKTLIKDMAEGLRQMHDDAGATHYDFKSLNCLIGSDGKAKIMDFGRSSDSRSAPVGSTHSISNPRWKAPETIYGENAGLRKDLEKRDEEAGKALQAFIGRLGLDPATTEQFSADLMKRIGSDMHIAESKSNDTRRTFATFETSGKADVWSLGVTAHQLFTDTLLPFAEVPDKYLWQLDDLIGGYAGADGHGAFTSAIGGDVHVFNSTQNPANDAFLNRILVADPDARPTAAQVANDPALGAKGVSGDAAHKLLALLTGRGSSTDDVARAVAALRTDMAPPAVVQEP